MKRKVRGIRKSELLLDLDLYRVDVPIQGVSNAKLSVVDMRPEGVQQTIVFVHGYGGCAETWERQINHFSRDYRVVVPDLRGHGQSDAPYTAYTMNEIIGDLHHMVESLKLPQKFVLVGHSFGGAICTEYANRYPDRLEKLVLIATAGEYPLPKPVLWIYRTPNVFFRPWWPYRPRWNAELHVMKRMMFSTVRHWQGWALFKNIMTDTLVITGAADKYFPRYVYEDVGKLIPNAEVVDVSSAKHSVQLERHEAVNRTIERFIDSNKRRVLWRDQDNRADDLLKARPWLSTYPKDMPKTIPIPERPLHSFLESAANWLPRRAATIFQGQKLTYKQLNERVNQFAHALIGQGIKPGDRVMVVLPNSPEMIIAYFAILKAGAVVVLPTPDAKADSILSEALQAGAAVMITMIEYEQMALHVMAHAPLKTVIFANITHKTLPIEHRRAIRKTRCFLMDSMIDDAKTQTRPPAIDVSPQDLAVIAFTSGTIDEPKGVCLTHRNLVANTLQTRHWVPDIRYGRDVFLSVLPFLHSYGMTAGMNVPIAIGATIVMLPVFEIQNVLEHIRRYRPSIFPGVPAMYMAINQAKDVRSYGLSSIKACICGAAPLPIEVQEQFEKLTRGRLVEGYGLTECSPITHANPLYGVRKVGSIGIPIPNTDARIVDLVSGEPVPTGVLGELVVRGPQVMAGYLGESATSCIKDGWLYTGDVAVVDADGYFQIIARKRDTIFMGDFSVYPRDVEEVLYENGKVLEAAVVGIGREDEGQKVKAYVVPRPGTKLSKEELLDLCRRRLEEYAVPYDIEFRESLPKSFIGKVLRRVLIEENNRKES